MMAVTSLNVLAMYMAILTVLVHDRHTQCPSTTVLLHITPTFVWRRDVTEYLMKNLTERGLSFTATAEREIAHDVKEKLRYIGVDPDRELKSTAENDKEKTSELPDGNITTVGAKRFRCAKVLSQPSFIDR